MGGQKELSQVRRSNALPFLNTNPRTHTKVSPDSWFPLSGCVCHTRTLLLAISDSSPIYIPSNQHTHPHSIQPTHPHTTLNSHTPHHTQFTHPPTYHTQSHTHTPHSIHTHTPYSSHTHTHHTQFTHKPPSSTTHKTHTSYPQLAHKYIYRPSTPHSSPIQRLLPRFSMIGTSLHLQHYSVHAEHAYPLMLSEQHFLIFLSSQHQKWTQYVTYAHGGSIS